jgi:hypothetical protein
MCLEIYSAFNETNEEIPFGFDQDLLGIIIIVSSHKNLNLDLISKCHVMHIKVLKLRTKQSITYIDEHVRVMGVNVRTLITGARILKEIPLIIALHE